MHEIRQSGPDAIDKSLPLFPQNGPIFLGRSNYDEMNLEILNRVKQALEIFSIAKILYIPSYFRLSKCVQVGTWNMVKESRAIPHCNY